jgi:hypothetical protein
MQYVRFESTSVVGGLVGVLVMHDWNLPHFGRFGIFSVPLGESADQVLIYNQGSLYFEVQEYSVSLCSGGT